MVGARHLFYGISTLKKYGGTGRAKWYPISTCSDETFALNYHADLTGMNKTKYYTIVSLLDQCYWIAGVLAGALCGSLFTFDTKGLDFAMTAMFLSIFADQWLKDEKAVHVRRNCTVYGSAAGLFIKERIRKYRRLNSRERRYSSFTHRSGTHSWRRRTAGSPRP